MANLEDALNAALHGVKQAFEGANSALHSCVVEAAEALGKVTGGKVSLRLHTAWEDVSGTLYELYLVSSQNGTVVGGYWVPNKGYPIAHGLVHDPDPDGVLASVGRINDLRIRLQEKGQIADEATLRKHFLDLLSNRDSPVVINTAYLMRR